MGVSDQHWLVSSIACPPRPIAKLGVKPLASLGFLGSPPLE